ncbi:hypothetical protein MPSEU_000664800 [Mayamaea pseudoterrestris]|nr:hypothetical protein MPSEU_000664800 [Mayamaea pseudoterrestris]
MMSAEAAANQARERWSDEPILASTDGFLPPAEPPTMTELPPLGHDDGENGDDAKDVSQPETSNKRKLSEQEPESQGNDNDDDNENVQVYAKKERAYYDETESSSPGPYPKHVLVPAADHTKEDLIEPLDHHHHHHIQPAAFSPPEKMGQNVLTPDSGGRSRGDSGYRGEWGAEAPPIYPRHQPYHHDVYRAPSYNPDMEYGRPVNNYGGHPHQQQYGRAPEVRGESRPPRRWACDYCNVATFLSYEEACAHEEDCARRHHDPYGRPPPRPPVESYHRPPPPTHHSGGLGALYHATQEVVTPPTPHLNQHSPWNTRGPPLPVLPHEQNYYAHGGYYERHDEPIAFHHEYPSYPPAPHGHGHHNGPSFYQKRMLLALATDKESLSDRQCYVRSEMVEIFAASDKEVAARHSKGAQKLVIGQVGIRCVHCSHLRPRDRAERAVCYPSSISRIYQTVADMQRFHFEQCREIPEHVRQYYRKLKTTRPRGVGSPQTYWVSSAQLMGLVDTEGGIRFDTEASKEQAAQYSQNPPAALSISTP